MSAASGDRERPGPGATAIRSGRIAARDVALIVLLTVGAAVSRWLGAPCGLPHLPTPDEQIYLGQYSAFVAHEEHPERRHRYATYPALFARAAAVIPRSETIHAADPLAREVERASRDTLFLRRCVALVAALAVPLTWWLALSFVSSSWALGAAALVAANVLHAANAAQARPHALLATAGMLAIVGALHHVRRGSARSAFLAGLGAASALVVLQSGAAFVLPLAWAIVVRWRADGRRALAHGALAFAVVLAAFLVAYPGVWLASAPTAGIATGDSAFLANLGLGLQRFRGGGHHAVWSAFYDHDPLLLACALFAMLVALAATLRGGVRAALPGPAMQVVLAFAVPYLAVLLLFDTTFVRFVVPLVPVVAVLAVAGLARASLGSWILALAVAGQTWNAVMLVRLQVAPDTCTLAADWLRAHADRERDRIALSPLVDLPLVRTTESLAWRAVKPVNDRQKWLQYQFAMDPTTRDRVGNDLVDLPLLEPADRRRFRERPDEYLAELGARYVVLDVQPPGARATMHAVRALVAERGVLVAEFTPQGDSGAEPYGIDPYLCPGYVGDFDFVRRMQTARALGPRMEIYELPRVR